MKKRIAILLCIGLLLLTACQINKIGKTDLPSNSQTAQSAEDNTSITAQDHSASKTDEKSSALDTKTEIDLIQDTLMRYLNDCWGYREGKHKLVFDTIVEMQDAEYHAFTVSSIEGEYSATFAVSLDQQKVYKLDEAANKWIEDINPEPWSKW